MNLSTVKWAQRDKNQSRELLGLFMCVCIALCTIVAHNIAQNRPDNFPSYPLYNHHCSDDVYFREGGNKISGKLVNAFLSLTSIVDIERNNYSMYCMLYYVGNLAHAAVKGDMQWFFGW